MIVLDKNQNKTLIVVTAPHCAVCKALNKSNKCSDLPFNKLLLLIDTNISDRLTMEMIYKSNDPHSFFKDMLLNNNIDYGKIDLDKDVSELLKLNNDFINRLTDINTISGIPEFYIRDDISDTIEHLNVREHSLENNMKIGESLVAILKNVK